MTNRPISPSQPDPTPKGQNEHELRTDLLINHLGFTPEDATAFLTGDQRVLEAVATRRMQSDVTLELSTDEGGSVDPR